MNDLDGTIGSTENLSLTFPLKQAIFLFAKGCKVTMTSGLRMGATLSREMTQFAEVVRNLTMDADFTGSTS